MEGSAYPWAVAGLLAQRPAQVDRLVAAQRYVNGVRQGAVGKGVLLSSGHRTDESLCEYLYRFDGVFFSQITCQLQHIHCGIAVQGGGIVFHSAQVPGAGAVLRGAVVHGGEIVVFSLHPVGGDAVATWAEAS